MPRLTFLVLCLCLAGIAGQDSRTVHSNAMKPEGKPDFENMIGKLDKGCVPSFPGFANVKYTPPDNAHFNKGSVVCEPRKPETEKLVLHLLIQDTNCEPVSGARVDIWQANETGVYDYCNVTHTVDDSGRAQFQTIQPGSYGRPRHIHVRVISANHETLVTSFFFAADGIDACDTPACRDPTLRIRTIGAQGRAQLTLQPKKESEESVSKSDSDSDSSRGSESSSDSDSSDSDSEGSWGWDWFGSESRSSSSSSSSDSRGHHGESKHDEKHGSHHRSEKEHHHHRFHGKKKIIAAGVAGFVLIMLALCIACCTCHKAKKSRRAMERRIRNLERIVMPHPRPPHGALPTADVVLEMTPMDRADIITAVPVQPTSASPAKAV